VTVLYLTYDGLRPARTVKEWTQALLAIMNDDGLRHRMGQSGRKKAEEHCALQVTGPKLVELLQLIGKAG